VTRIPHSALLSRYAKVDPNTGIYSKPTISAVVYGTMTVEGDNWMITQQVASHLIKRMGEAAA
jgi:hypothetical protein